MTVVMETVVAMTEPAPSPTTAPVRSRTLRAWRPRDRNLIIVALLVQGVCAAFFISEILSSYIGFRSAPIPWAAREIIEVGAAFGLLLGFGLGGYALTRSRRRHQVAEAQLRRASAAFIDLVEEAFAQWALTPAERDVALLCIKGFSIQEIGGIRQTSDGTVKAQTNAIYRKADVTGRNQLLSLFIDALMEDGVFSEARAATFEETAPATSGSIQSEAAVH